MTAGGLIKTGWHWTRKGWKRSPRRVKPVKKVAAAAKRRPLKKVVVKPAERERPPTYAEARKLAAEQGRADSAPTPPVQAAKPAPRPPRKAWSGKYDDLAQNQKNETPPKGRAEP